MRIITLGLVVAGLSLSGARISAATLNVGSAVNPAVTETPGAVQILGSLTAAYSQGSGQFAGTVTSWVVQDSANPLGGLSFWYQIQNTGPNALEGLSLSGFGAMPVDVAYIWTSVSASPGPAILPGGVRAPTDVTRVTDDTIHWDFGITSGALATGELSDILAVNTGSQNWGGWIGSAQDTYGQNIEILAPVPEPSTLAAGALLLLPLGARTCRAIRKALSV